MTAKPWVKFYPSDFLNGIADLPPELVGAYTIILALIWDRGGPIDDDPSWIARRLNVGTKAWTHTIRPKLLASGKIEIRNGLIGNKRAIEEVERRDGVADKNRKNALSRWHQQPDLFEEESTKESAKNPPKNRVINRPIHPPIKKTKSAENGQSVNATASGLARARSRNQKLESNERTNLHTPTRVARPNGKEPQVRYDDQSIDLIFGAVCEAAGHSPPDDMIDRSKEFIRKWKDAGISVDHVILPTIRKIMAATPDPVTSSLKRFDRDIMGANAQTKARAAQPEEVPIFKLDGEDERIVPIRQAIATAIGTPAYMALAQRTKFSIDGDVIKLNGALAPRLKDEIGGKRMTRIASQHGFRDIW